MATICSQCGARWSADTSCREYFEDCLGHEYENPASFGAVHHLLVTCNMLQHNQYSRPGWIEARRMLARFVQDETSPQEMLAENRARLTSAQRDWSITHGPRLEEFRSIRWTHHITAVRLDSVEIYCADVRRWAAAVLVDTQDLADRLEGAL